MNPTLAFKNLKLQWEILFFLTFLNIDRNNLNFFRYVIIQDFMGIMLLESILDFGKCHNQKTHESESAGFLVWEPEVQNRF